MIRQMFKKYPISYLLFGGFAGFFIVLLVIVIGVSYRFSVGEIVDHTAFYQQNMLRELNKQVGIQLAAVEQTSLAISRYTDMQKYLSEEGDPYKRFNLVNNMTSDFQNIVFSMPFIHSIYLYMNYPPPYPFQSPIQFRNLETIKRESWYHYIENSDFVWIGHHTIQTYQGDVPVISFARKICTINRGCQAILVINIKASEIQRLIADENGDLNRVILDSGGRPITYIGKLRGQDYMELIHDLKKASHVNLNKEGFMKHGDYLVVWSKLITSDWLIIEVTSWSNLTKGSVRMATLLFSIGLLVILIALIFTYLTSKQFTKPIKDLVKRMSSFSPGSKKDSLPQDYQNEFGLLFKGYDRLTDRIEELYRSLERQYRRQQEAEIAALQAMINPHFLYNTLDQLNWMAIEAGEDRMSHVLELMGKMFRIGLSNGENWILIRDELTHLECYLKIQQIRLGDGLEYQIKVPEPLKNLYIPKLTLQPFVENAIIHGFHGRNEGFIEIFAYEETDDILFTITDNGVGIPENWQTKRRKTGGYGIRNVRERIEAYFGHRYGVEIRGQAGKGTSAVIRIPKLKEKQSHGEEKHVEDRHY